MMVVFVHVKYDLRRLIVLHAIKAKFKKKGLRNSSNNSHSNNNGYFYVIFLQRAHSSFK